MAEEPVGSVGRVDTGKARRRPAGRGAAEKGEKKRGGKAQGRRRVRERAEKEKGESGGKTGQYAAVRWQEARILEERLLKHRRSENVERCRWGQEGTALRTARRTSREKATEADGGGERGKGDGPKKRRQYD